MLEYAIILVAILLLICTLLKREKQKRGGKPLPKHPGLPILGSALELIQTSMIYKLAELANRYGEIYSLRVFRQNLVVLNSESVIRKAYCSEMYSRYFNDKPKTFYTKYFRPSEDSVGCELHAYGGMYKKLKKTYMKALHTHGSSKQLVDEMLIEMKNVQNKINSKETKEFDFAEFLKRSLSNTIALLLIGEKITDGDPRENLFWQKSDVVDYFVHHFAECVMSFFPALRLFTFTKFGQMFHFGMDVNKLIADKFFYSVKREHRDGDKEGVVHFYLQQQRKQKLEGDDMFLTDDRIVSQIFETIEAGMVSTWSILTNSMLILLNHPECQTKIHEEIDQVIGRDRLPNISDQTYCPYTLAFEKEVMRYIPVAPLLAPHVCNEDIEFEGYNIQKNSMVVANVWYVHHDEDIWVDPWNFRPERFLDENGDLLPSDHLFCRSLIPFGLGERRCTGEAFGKNRYFLYLVTLLQHHSFESPEGSEQRSCDPRNGENFDIKLTMRAKTFRVRAVERKPIQTN